MGSESVSVEQHYDYVYISIRATLYRDVPLIAWSGSVVSSIVRKALKRYQQGAPKGVEPVSVSPLFIENLHKGVEGKLVISGLAEDQRSKPLVLSIGTRVSFSFSLRVLEEFRGDVVKIFDELSETLSEFGLQLRSYEFEFLEEFPSVEDVSEADRYLVKVFYCPTIFVFRGWRVLYPSPTRLIHALARNCALISPTYSRDLKKKARALSRYVELVQSKCRVITLSIGRGRQVKAFLGTATYGVYSSKRARELVALLRVGSKLNVGKSRGIGFGYVKLESIEPIT